MLLPEAWDYIEYWAEPPEKLPRCRFQGDVFRGLRLARGITQEEAARWFDGESPLTYIVSLNSRRRHLTPSQRAAIAVKHTVMLQHGSNQYEEKVESSHDDSKTRTEVAKVAGVSTATVERVKYTVMLEVGDVATQKDGTQSCVPKSASEVAKVAGVCVSEILDTRLCMMVSSFGFGRRKWVGMITGWRCSLDCAISKVA